MLALAADLPDPLVRAVPVGAHPVHVAHDVLPELPGDRRAVLVVEVDRVEQLAVDVELELARGTVPHTDGAGLAVALQVVEGELVQLATAVDAVDDLERPVRVVGDARLAAVAEPADKRTHLVGEADPEEPVERERGVADPGVAVVPVPVPADVLGQAGRRRGDDGAGGLEGQQLEQERAPADGLAPPPGVGAAVEPVPPVVGGLAEQVELGVARERLLQRPVGVEVAELERHPVAARQVEVAHDGRAVGVGAVDLQRADGRQAQLHRPAVRPAALGREHGPLVAQLDGVRAPAVVEGRRHADRDLDLATEDAHVADQPVVAGVRPDLADGHVVHDLGRAALAHEPRHEDVPSPGGRSAWWRSRRRPRSRRRRPSGRPGCRRRRTASRSAAGNSQSTDPFLPTSAAVRMLPMRP